MSPVLLHVADRLAIHARGSLVLSDSLPRLLEDVTPPDVVVQGVKAPIRCPLGCCI